MRGYLKSKQDIHGSLMFEKLIFNAVFSLIITTIMHWLFKKEEPLLTNTAASY